MRQVPGILNAMAFSRGELVCLAREDGDFVPLSADRGYTLLQTTAPPSTTEGVLYFPVGEVVQVGLAIRPATTTAPLFVALLDDLPLFVLPLDESTDDGEILGLVPEAKKETLA